MTQSRRALCGAADIKGWSSRLVPEQIRSQQALVTVVLAACRGAGLPEEIVQSSGDGVLIMPPSDIDESTVIPALISELQIALWQENRLLSEKARIRLRFALTSGLVTPGPAGFNGAAVIDCFRLLDSGPVKAALDDFPHAQLAVIVSDHLFQDVIRNGFRSLRADDFWPIRSSLPDKGFAMNAWLYVSDREDGPPVDSVAGRPTRHVGARVGGAVPGGAPPGGPGAGRLGGSGPGVAETETSAGGAADPGSGPDTGTGAEPDGGLNAVPAAEIGKARTLLEQGRARDALRLLEAVPPAEPGVWAALLDARADALMRLDEYDRAAMDLEELLGLSDDPLSPPGPSALLRLGRCRAVLGAVREARQTWMFLLEHRPASIEAHLELGRLERRVERYATAQSHLLEGIRLVRSGGEANGLLDDLLHELAALPVTDHEGSAATD